MEQSSEALLLGKAPIIHVCASNCPARLVASLCLCASNLRFGKCHTHLCSQPFCYSLLEPGTTAQGGGKCSHDEALISLEDR